MTDNGIPYDREAEESLLGAMLLSPIAVDTVIDSLTGGDFYSPGLGTMFDAIVSMHENGTIVDTLTVRDALKNSNALDSMGGEHRLLELQCAVPTIAGAGRYAEIIIDHSLRRQMIIEANELRTMAVDLSLDSRQSLELHEAIIGSMGAGTVDKEPDDVAIEDFVNRPKTKISPWVVEGIIRRQHKMLLVAGEGAGKSWLLRFIALCAAYGVHPFRHRAITPVRVMVVDAENPEDALYDAFETILKKVRAESDYQDPVSRLWWRPAGINLRNRVDRAEFENLIRVRRPDLLAIGPLYAIYENSNKDFGWEQAAREVQSFLKKMMVRYNFGLMLEDHAPNDRSGGMRPYGSSFWRRWPDLGFGLEPIDPHIEDSFRVNRWRGERVPTDWPNRLERGSVTHSSWPFVGYWDDKKTF